MATRGSFAESTEEDAAWEGVAGLSVDSIVLGMLSNNVYYVGDGASGVLVDPSCKPEEIADWVGGRPVDAIIVTHYHFDHMGAAFALRGRYGCPVYASAVDAPYVEDPDKVPAWHRKVDGCPVDVRLQDGDVVHAGAMEWQAISTPGHSPGSMCFYAQHGAAADGGAANRGILLAGDTLFCNAIGRTDFFDGSPQDMEASLARLAKLPDETDVFPGHGRPTTIAAERCGALA